MLKKIKGLYFKVLMLFGWDYQTKIFKVLMGKLPRKKSFRYLIEALSQKQYKKLLELKTSEYEGIFHLIALYGGNLDILSILIKKIPQKTLFKLLQEQEEGVNGHTPFHLAASCNLEMMLLLIEKMSADQLHALLTMGFPDYVTPLNYIISHYKSGTEISKNVVHAIANKLLDSQFFSLILTQLKFINDSNKGADNVVLIVKVSPKVNGQDSGAQLHKINEFKKQMIEQSCLHMQQGEGYSFPHIELYDHNSCLLRIFLIQMRNKELYQATDMKGYGGFISLKSLLPMILNYNKLEFNFHMQFQDQNVLSS